MHFAPPPMNGLSQLFRLGAGFPGEKESRSLHCYWQAFTLAFCCWARPALSCWDSFCFSSSAWKGRGRGKKERTVIQTPSPSCQPNCSALSPAAAQGQSYSCQCLESKTILVQESDKSMAQVVCPPKSQDMVDADLKYPNVFMETSTLLLLSHNWWVSGWEAGGCRFPKACL